MIIADGEKTHVRKPVLEWRCVDDNLAVYAERSTGTDGVQRVYTNVGTLGVDVEHLRLALERRHARAIIVLPESSQFAADAVSDRRESTHVVPAV